VAVIPPVVGLPRDGFILVPRSAIQHMETETGTYSPSTLGVPRVRLEICDPVAPADVHSQVLGGTSVYPWPTDAPIIEPTPRDEDDILKVKKELREARKRIRELELENKARQEEVADYEGEIEALRAGEVDEDSPTTEKDYSILGYDPGAVERRIKDVLAMKKQYDQTLTAISTPVFTPNKIDTSNWSDGYYDSKILRGKILGEFS
jgi:hypothetical protein